LTADPLLTQKPGSAGAGLDAAAGVLCAACRFSRSPGGGHGGCRITRTRDFAGRAVRVEQGRVTVGALEAGTRLDDGARLSL